MKKTIYFQNRFNLIKERFIYNNPEPEPKIETPKEEVSKNIENIMNSKKDLSEETGKSLLQEEGPGEKTIFRTDGTKEIGIFNKDDQLIKGRRYAKEGFKREEGIFFDGELEKGKVYDKDGNIRYDGTFDKNGVLIKGIDNTYVVGEIRCTAEGEFNPETGGLLKGKIIFPDGSIYMEGTFDKNGPYDISGTGPLLSGTKYDTETGKPLESGTFSSDGFLIEGKSYYNGILAKEGVFSGKNGDLVQGKKYELNTGTLLQEGTFSDNGALVNGTDYKYLTGEIYGKAEGIFDPTNGNLVKGKLYWPNGKLRSEGTFNSQGEASLVTGKAYDEKGKLIEEIKY